MYNNKSTHILDSAHSMQGNQMEARSSIDQITDSLLSHKQELQNIAAKNKFENVHIIGTTLKKMTLLVWIKESNMPYSLFNQAAQYEMPFKCQIEKILPGIAVDLIIANDLEACVARSYQQQGIAIENMTLENLTAFFHDQQPANSPGLG